MIARARSLHSDRAGRATELDRYVATELRLELDCYIATERDELRSDRALARARSLRSDRAGRALGHYVATEL
ncbi:hypothetical protein DY000_02051629 [Brassica cretica]|uniref:Uncharacterized protein n=1 Tax=Brassica cretica TaxID=69181 RepID=A0ABQ7F412_BRACR|nr:hypothetical protein DY000_02051629 [Brassica cretica]